MREQKSTRCPHCRAKAVRGRPGAARKTAYKTLPCLPLPSELLIPTCSRCRALFLPTNQKTGALLQLLYVAELRQRAQVAISTQGQVLAPGTRVYQAYFRNSAAYCTPATFNLTNGTRIYWCP